MSTRNSLIVLGCTVLLGGCSYFVEKPTPGFGDSVRNMIEQQTYDANAAQAAPVAPGMDGDKAADAMKAYRAPAKPSNQPLLPGQ